jgi:hypothetical protein
MLRQIFEDRLPRRLGADVDVGTRPDARLVDQRTEGHVDEPSSRTTEKRNDPQTLQTASQRQVPTN